MNKEKYKLEDYWLIQYQILQSNIIGLLEQTVMRIFNEILEGKELMNEYSKANIFRSWGVRVFVNSHYLFAR